MNAAPRLLAALLLGGTVAWAAETPPPAPALYFNDYAGVVAEPVARRLNETLRRFDEETSSQVLVVVYPELPSPSLEDFTIRAVEAWKPGRKELDNGAVLFVFMKDRRMRIEVGYGLEGALPDATANRIIDERIVPAFREGRYGEGIEAGVDAVLAATRGEYTAPPREGDSGPMWVVFLLPLGFLLLNWLLFRHAQHGRHVTYLPGGRRGGRTMWYGRRGGGYWGGGGGGWGGGGGGFSGGGGSFGGGGASGSW